MTFLDFLTKDALTYCRCPNAEAWGKIVELAYRAEQEGERVFSHDRFETARDRAQLAIPYAAIVPMDRAQDVLNVVELAILQHRYHQHDEKERQRIQLLRRRVEVSELAEILPVTAHDWWNA